MTETHSHNLFALFYKGEYRICAFLLLALIPYFSFSQVTWDGGGDGVNWSSANNWNPNGVPLSTDNIEFSGANYTGITVDGNYTCNNLTLGNSAHDITVTISGSNSLNINGDLKINNSNSARTYILDAATGNLNVNGTFSVWNTNGTNSIRVSTGTIIFTPAVTVPNSTKVDITFSSSGIINFNGGLINNRGAAQFVTVGGCTVQFGGSYTQQNNSMTWNISSNVIFAGGAPTITPTATIFFGNFQINSGVTVSLAGNIQIAGDWTNNGGTLSGGANMVTFESIGNTIGGSSSTTFPDLRLGNTLNNVAITLSQNITCANFIMDADNSSRTFTHDGSDPSLTVTGNVTISQPTNNSKSDLWDINGGSATIAGNLIFAGSSNIASRIGKVNVTSGSFTLAGTVTWMSGQSAPQEVATEIITVSSGTITFNSSVAMDQGSGTLQATGTGMINFNGSAPSFSLNATVAGNTTNAAFTTLWGSTLNFAAGITNANAALTIADGSFSVFTENGTITPTAAITFGYLQINAAKTVTLAGNISLTDDWTNLGGTFVPGTNTVVFSGGADQTITKAGSTETFYGLTSNTTGPLALAPTTDLMITSILTMTAGNYNLSGRTLTLGNSAAATLVRTAGIIYGGTFKRWLPVAAISSTVAPLYGLFPIGTSLQYRPIEINSTVNPTTAGYVQNIHTDPLPTNFVTDVAYTDNEGHAIQRIANIIDALSTSGLAGGTYNLYITYTDLATTGVLTDLKLETYTGAVMGSVGVTVATAGTASSPIVKRSGLSATDLSNDFVIGTKNKSPLVTPIRPYYYSRKNGNWNDVTAGNGTWSYTSGGSGTSCDCIPVAYGYAIISTGQTVSINVASSIEYVDINTTSTLNGTATFTVTKDISTAGSGKFSPTSGSWTISRNATLVGTGSASLPAATSIAGILNIGAGTILTMNSGVGLTVSGNLIVDGTLALGTSTLTLNGVSGTTIEGSAGSANITGGGATINITTGNKTISSGTNLTLAPTFAITGAITVTNNGTATISGNMTGSVASSTWANAGGSVLNVSGTVFATGSLNGSFTPNTINYNGAGAQTVKKPTASYYDLSCSNAGTKSLAADIAVTDLLTIQDAAILDVGSNNLTGVGGLNMSGTSGLILASAIASFPGLPELTGTYNLSGGTITFNRAGNQNIRSLNGPSAVAYYNVDFANGGTKTLSGPITAQNNLTISGSAKLDVSATNYDVTLAGNWNVTSTDANPFVERSGTVIFNGTAAQAITTALAAGETFNNLTINNASATGVTMSSKITMAAILTLTDGLLYSTAANLLTMNAGSSIGDVSNNSFVSGPVAKIGSTNFTFPVGKDAKYRPIDVTSLSGSETFTAEYFHADPNSVPYDVTSKDAILNHIGRCEYWILNRAAAVNAFVTLSWDGYSCGVDNLTDIAVARWNGATWKDHGNGGTTGAIDPATGTVISSALVTSFSPFTLASKGSGTNPLPVELLSFDAYPNGNLVDAIWSTASEMNSDYFMLQRSKEGIDFEDVKKINAEGNSTITKNYSSVDQEPYEGVSYYRLKQVDLNGEFAYSNIAEVNIEVGGIVNFSVYPNPAVDKVNISIEGSKGSEVLIVVYDILGREYFSKVILLSTRAEVIAFSPAEKLSPGVYTIMGSSNNKIYKKKIIIL